MHQLIKTESCWRKTKKSPSITRVNVSRHALPSHSDTNIFVDLSTANNLIQSTNTGWTKKQNLLSSISKGAMAVKWRRQIQFEGKTIFSPIWCVKTKCVFRYVLGSCIQNAFRIVQWRQSKKQNTPLFTELWDWNSKSQTKRQPEFLHLLYSLLFISWVAPSV
jgi:hypothetical protein